MTFVFQEIRAAEDSEFETFNTKNILLNEGIRVWTAKVIQKGSVNNFMIKVLKNNKS